jgi:hypothetical protein
VEKRKNRTRERKKGRKGSENERRNSKTVNKLSYDIHQNVSIKKVKNIPQRITAITNGNGLSHPTRSLSRIVCKWMYCKGTSRLDFQANT